MTIAHPIPHSTFFALQSLFFFAFTLRLKFEISAATHRQAALLGCRDGKR